MKIQTWNKTTRIIMKKPCKYCGEKLKTIKQGKDLTPICRNKKCQMYSMPMVSLKHLVDIYDNRKKME